MSLKYYAELAVAVIAGLLSVNFLFQKLVLDYNRDLTPVALSEQANITTVRKKNETALYRNFLVPIGFPLTTGLGLSLGYKIRNGNFMDVWKAIMDVTGAKGNYVSLPGGSAKKDTVRKYSLPEINGMANKIITDVYEKYDVNEVGLNVSAGTLPGFVISIASMIHSVRSEGGKGLLHFLAAVPRQRNEKVEVLVIDSWQAFGMLNKSEEWYKLVIVCDDDASAMKPSEVNDMSNVVTWDSVISGYTESTKFEYDPPKDNSDELKPLFNVTSMCNQVTAFNQLNLVSSVSSFIKTFPLHHELSDSDVITDIRDTFTVAKNNVQIWPKVFSVLLLGGSAQFVTASDVTLDSLAKTTLLVCEPKTLTTITNLVKESNGASPPLQGVKLSLATAFLSEGVMVKVAKIHTPQLEQLRAIYLGEELSQEARILSFASKIPSYSKGQIQSKFTTAQLNQFRAVFGARLVVELYCPFIVMGPISETNFYDYRIFSPSVDAQVTCVGPLNTSLEGKMVNIEGNPNMDVEQRQGMLCIRGFTIGRPLGDERLAQAAKLSEDVAGSEGWIPLTGVYGLWGQDGCLYIYN
ncbi:hypothetical protein DAKH74_006430 [Maudiozyma humilis]|uniref:Uncharacterized protein n=1 Tax=Maudiozyma humilis TaxID=51915 RepID=A0AAV5RSB2_MAUHU|nr:hypothetical protein DAKH74_006430 [Kazachstania humilis]